MNLGPIQGGAPLHPDVEQPHAAAEASAAAAAPDPRLDHVAAAIARIPMRTTTPSGILGDPVNVAFVGTADDLGKRFARSGWSVAGSGVAASLAYVASVAARRVDPEAPVSDLLLLGRRQDLAFEQASSADARHHVRFWSTGAVVDGKPVWVGAATRDAGVALKRNFDEAARHAAAERQLTPWALLPTTHRIDMPIDAERDKVARDLHGGRGATGRIGGWGGEFGTNGDGFTFKTDGQIRVIVGE